MGHAYSAGRDVVVGYCLVVQSMSWPEISNSFLNCTVRERARITPPPLDDITWPDIDFLGWRDRRMPEVACLVVEGDGGPQGVMMRAGVGRTDGARRKSMCALCLTLHQVGDVLLFAARRAGTRGRNGDTAGTYICADLGCSAYVRSIRKPAVPQPFETISTEDRVERLRHNVARFVAHVAGE